MINPMFCKREGNIELIFLYSRGKGTLVVRSRSIQETPSVSVNSQIYIEKYRPFLISEINGYLYMYHTSGICEGHLRILFYTSWTIGSWMSL